MWENHNQPKRETNFSSEWCRCGADMKKPPMGSTKAYIPLVALIEAPQMRRYHGKLLTHVTLNIVVVAAVAVECCTVELLLC